MEYEMLNLNDMDTVPEKGHYETVKEFTTEQPIYDEQGNQIGTKTVVIGRERKWVCTDEEELKKAEISRLKQQLANTDYKAIKYAEGAISESEYAPIKAERAAWRARINQLEEELQ